MALFPVKLPPGVVRGATPYETPDRWWDVNLIRWRQGVLEPVGGWQRITSTPRASTIRALHVWRDNNNTERLLVGEDEALEALVDGTYYDVTPANFVPLNDAGGVGYGTNDYSDEDYGDARSTPSAVWQSVAGMWSFTNWGEDVLCMANTDGRFLYYDVQLPTTDVVQVGKRNISFVAHSGGTTTITTATPHDFTAGRTIVVAGTTPNGGVYNGTFTIVATPTSTTFTYNQGGTSNISTTATAGTATLTNVIANAVAIQTTPERHVLAIGADNNSRRIAWCSREDYTDWNYASTTNTAGYIDVEANSPLRTIVPVREGALVFSDTEVFLVRYASLPYIFTVERLGETKLVSPMATATFEGKCVWYSETGFRIFEGGTIVNVPCTVFDWITNDININAARLRCFGAWNGAFSEVWFFHPSENENECDRYVIWNYSENWWSFGYLARTAMSPASERVRPLMAGQDNNIYDHEYGWLDAGLTRVGQVWAETAQLGLGPPSDRGIEITQLMPANAEGTNSMRFRFYGKQTPEGAERTYGPYTVRADGYVDTRISSRDVRMRIEANQDIFWSLGTIRMDIAEGPRR
jgi:hypothetical protein